MISVRIPTLHADQVRAYRLPGRFKAVRCGRRWGKTTFGETVAEDAAIKRMPVGWFAPDYKRMIEVYNDIVLALKPVVASSSKTEGVIRTTTGGRIDFWTLEDENAGRSRKYKRVIIDEAAFTNPKTMMGTWEKAIQPTLLDYAGTAVVLSNTNGVDPENFFWRICNEPKHGFVEYHAPSYANPDIPERLPKETLTAWRARREAEFADLKARRHPLVYQQEYLADFVDWSGVAFFALPKLLEDGHPIAFPRTCEAVFAVIDTATKTGKENDGTAVLFCAMETQLEVKRRLILLDYDYVQIEGAVLEDWLPSVYARLEVLAKECGARGGWQGGGVHIEDKSSGMVLLQQAAARGWPAVPIDSKLTSLGKVERAINASGAVWREEVAFSERAFERVVTFKDVTKNHLQSQIIGFRVGVKDQLQDDLLDCFTYSVALALGNSEGF